MLNEYDEILACLSDVLRNENAEYEFYSIDNIDDKYEYFSKHSGKNFSKEKFKEVMNFLEEQTKKFKNNELSEESLKKVAGGELRIPETEHRSIIEGLLKPGVSYYTDVLDIGYSAGRIINLIKGKIEYETQNEALKNEALKNEALKNEANRLKEECNKRRRMKGLPEIK